MAKTIVLDCATEVEALQRKVEELEQENEDLKQENKDLKRANKAIRQQNLQLMRCEDFKILLKSGLQEAWNNIGESYPDYAIIFFDLDGLAEINSRDGYSGANQKIRNAFNCVRSTEIVGRWFSGDEFVLIVRKELVDRIIARLKANFGKQKMTFTYAAAQCGNSDLELCVKPLFDAVQRKKAERFIDRSGAPLEPKQPPERCRLGKSIS